MTCGSTAWRSPFSTRSASEMAIVALGFGANLGAPARQIAVALNAIVERRIGRVLRVSSLWRTPPWGVTDQPPFLNACAMIATHLSPMDLLRALKSIESDLGRTAGTRWGPRAIDIDILFYDDVAVKTPDLTLPHEHMFERAFVLAPLAEIAGERVVAGRRIVDALAKVDTRGLKRLKNGADWPSQIVRGTMGETITLRCSDGVSIDAWCASPSGMPRGGVLVLQEIFGVNAHIRSVADRFAAAGYLAIAPALFDRVERNVELGYDGADRKRAMDIRGRTKLDETMRDLAAAVTVAKEAGPVGIVGYCWGGTLAWAAASRIEGIAAAVGYYGGGIAAMLDDKPHIPVMLHFGARDKHIPLTDVEKIREAYPAVPVFVYDADHGFNCDARASYDAAAADVARERTMEFFAEHLSK